MHQVPGVWGSSTLQHQACLLSMRARCTCCQVARHMWTPRQQQLQMQQTPAQALTLLQQVQCGKPGLRQLLRVLRKSRTHEAKCARSCSSTTQAAA
jgi:hypothetical protein